MFDPLNGAIGYTAQWDWLRLGHGHSRTCHAYASRIYTLILCQLACSTMPFFLAIFKMADPQWLAGPRL